MEFRTSQPMWLPFAFLVGAALAVVVSTRDASGADPSKTLRVEFRVAESGFDPQAISDSYSFHVVNAIFDPPYTYDYFARPVRLIPNTAADLPRISEGGRTYTFSGSITTWGSGPSLSSRSAPLPQNPRCAQAPRLTKSPAR